MTEVTSKNQTLPTVELSDAERQQARAFIDLWLWLSPGRRSCGEGWSNLHMSDLVSMVAEYAKAKERKGYETSPQAPIARIVVYPDPADGSGPGGAELIELYAPGLPPGEHDVYLDPSAPGIPGNAQKATEQRRGDPRYVEGKNGHYWTCGKCQYVNDSSLRHNRCGGCGEFQKGYAENGTVKP